MKIFQLFLALLLLTATFYESVNSQNINLTPCLTGDWTACGIAIGTVIYKKFNSWSDIDTKPAFGTICNSQFKGGWYRWQWTWSGKFWCPSLSATITGESTHWKSRGGAIEHAIQDYVTKMTSAGLLKPEQLSG